jgi:phenylalanyl-tRNA synthetase beta chain
MPKIEVNERAFFDLVGKRYTDPAALEELLPAAKAELDEWKPGEGKDDERTIKIELNDTNRPDLWSTGGLARQLRVYLGGKIPDYPFFSRKGALREPPKDLRVIVDPNLKGIRPYITAFLISGKPITDAVLRDVIQTQEKLCWNYGRKRKSIAMGVYRAELIKFPIHYVAADPDATSFVPLGMTRKLSLRNILKEHPKGIEFGSIVAGLPRFPYIHDDDGETVSFPPVINSDRIGGVKVGDSRLFVEITGTDLPTLNIACNIVACDFADSGYEITPVRIEYPYDTAHGRSVVTPYYFQEPVSAELPYVHKILGDKLTMDETVSALNRMADRTEVKGDTVTVFPGEYRNDFLHAADIVEDVAMGRGLESFKPQAPRDFTIGRITPLESLSRKAKSIMVGLGFQEMIYNYLGSRKDYIERMNLDGKDAVQISNPMSENFEFVRNSILPSLLASEAESGRATYPHHIFEVGKVCYKNDEENYGVSTRGAIGWLSAVRDANYNLAASQFNSLMYFLGREYSVVACEDPRFIHGRTAAVMYSGRRIGLFGEVDPAVLSNWNITMPCIAGEVEIEALL